jgi:surface polysaccharide O-acyltransferase-like enzyme
MVSAVDAGPFAAKADLAAVENKGRLYGLDWLRFFAILAIVSIHCSDEVLRRHGWFPSINGEAMFYYAFNTVLRFGTLTFFMMSGFLMESRLQRDGKRPEARWKRYAVPLIIASLLYTAVTLGEDLVQKQAIEPGVLLIKLVCGQAFYHIWFLLNALVYAATHRVLRLFTSPRLFGMVAVGYSLIFAFTHHYWQCWENYGAPAIALRGLVFGAAYYITGIWVASHLAVLRRIPIWVKTLLMVIGSVAAALYGILLRERCRFNSGLEMLSLGLFLTALNHRTPPPPLARRIMSCSLGIYLWHPLILMLVHIPERKLLNRTLSGPQDLTWLLFDIVIALGGSLLLSETLACIPKLRPIMQ